jgi:hypothetical protein
MYTVSLSTLSEHAYFIFLGECAVAFSMVIFTASAQNYTESYLDPEHGHYILQ